MIPILRRGSLRSRILTVRFSISTSDHSIRQISVLAHCGRYSEANNPPKWNKLLAVIFSIFNQSIQFILSGSAIALVGCPYQVEVF
jgi:hypothetical protein